MIYIYGTWMNQKLVILGRDHLPFKSQNVVEKPATGRTSKAKINQIHTYMYVRTYIPKPTDADGFSPGHLRRIGKEKRKEKRDEIYTSYHHSGACIIIPPTHSRPVIIFCLILPCVVVFCCVVFCSFYWKTAYIACTHTVVMMTK